MFMNPQYILNKVSLNISILKQGYVFIGWPEVREQWAVLYSLSQYSQWLGRTTLIWGLATAHKQNWTDGLFREGRGKRGKVGRLWRARNQGSYYCGYLGHNILGDTGGQRAACLRVTEAKEGGVGGIYAPTPSAEDSCRGALTAWWGADRGTDHKRPSSGKEVRTLATGVPTMVGQVWVRVSHRWKGGGLGTQEPPGAGRSHKPGL